MKYLISRDAPATSTMIYGAAIIAGSNDPLYLYMYQRRTLLHRGLPANRFSYATQGSLDLPRSVYQLSAKGILHF